MTPTIRFLIGFAVVYFIVGLTLNVFLGPPGMSTEYLQEHKVEHDRYLDAVKSPEYKLWTERPKLTEDDSALAAKIIFVSEYEGRHDFLDEQRRSRNYELSSEIFKVLMILVLAFRFGRRPIASLLDSAISEIGYRIQKAEDKAFEAQGRKKAAEQKMAGFHAERDRILSEAEERIVEEKQKIGESTLHALEQLTRETEDRRRQALLKGERALKEVLVDCSIDVLVKKLETEKSPETESILIDNFVDQLGKST